MAEEEKEMQPCPGCGAEIAVGTAVCPKCGVNVLTGEAYQTRVERSQQRKELANRFRLTTYVGVTTVISIILIAGCMYQNRALGPLRSSSGDFEAQFETLGNQQMHFFAALEEVDELAAEDQREKAVKLAEEIATKARARIDTIEQNTKRQGRSGVEVSLRERSRTSAEIGLLANIETKARYLQKRLAESDGA